MLHGCPRWPTPCAAAGYRVVERGRGAPLDRCRRAARLGALRRAGQPPGAGAAGARRRHRLGVRRRDDVQPAARRPGAARRRRVLASPTRCGSSGSRRSFGSDGRPCTLDTTVTFLRDGEAREQQLIQVNAPGSFGGYLVHAWQYGPAASLRITSLAGRPLLDGLLPLDDRIDGLAARLAELPSLGLSVGRPAARRRQQPPRGATSPTSEGLVDAARLQPGETRRLGSLEVRHAGLDAYVTFLSRRDPGMALLFAGAALLHARRGGRLLAAAPAGDPQPSARRAAGGGQRRALPAGRRRAASASCDALARRRGSAMTSVVDLWRAIDPEARLVSGSSAGLVPPGARRPAHPRRDAAPAGAGRGRAAGRGRRPACMSLRCRSWLPRWREARTGAGGGDPGRLRRRSRHRRRPTTRCRCWSAAGRLPAWPPTAADYLADEPAALERRLRRAAAGLRGGGAGGAGAGDAGRPGRRAHRPRRGDRPSTASCAHSTREPPDVRWPPDSPPCTRACWAAPVHGSRARSAVSSERASAWSSGSIRPGRCRLAVRRPAAGRGRRGCGRRAVGHRARTAAAACRRRAHDRAPPVAHHRAEPHLAIRSTRRCWRWRAATGASRRRRGCWASTATRCSTACGEPATSAGSIRAGRRTRCASWPPPSSSSRQPSARQPHRLCRLHKTCRSGRPHDWRPSRRPGARLQVSPQTTPHPGRSLIVPCRPRSCPPP